MGGVGTWALAAAHPKLFAAIVPICGGVLFQHAGNYETMTREERRALVRLPLHDNGPASLPPGRDDHDLTSCCLWTQSPPSATDMRPLINTPAYIFHGARDGGAVGSLTAHAALTAAAEEAGVPSRVRLAIYPQTDDRHHSRSSFHDSWTQTYEFTGLYEWLLEQRREAPRL